MCGRGASSPSRRHVDAFVEEADEAGDRRGLGQRVLVAPGEVVDGAAVRARPTSRTLRPCTGSACAWGWAAAGRGRPRAADRRGRAGSGARTAVAPACSRRARRRRARCAPCVSWAGSRAGGGGRVDGRRPGRPPRTRRRSRRSRAARARRGRGRRARSATPSRVWPAARRLSGSPSVVWTANGTEGSRTVCPSGSRKPSGPAGAAASGAGSSSPRMCSRGTA